MSRSISYAPLLRITVLHGYYDAGLARPLHLAPTQDTARVLQCNQCRLRETTGQTEIWYGNANGQIPAKDLEPETVLGFTFNSDAPDFLTVTQPDWPQDGPVQGDPVAGCLYFSNKNQTGTTPLTIASAEAQVLPVQRRQMSVPRDKTALTLTRWIDDTVVWEGPDPNAPPGFIDLAGVTADGRYVLAGDGETLGDFYLTDRPAQSFLGALEIGWTADAFTGSDDRPRGVTLAFTARTGFWHYIVSTVNPDMPLNEAEIINAAGEMLFSAPQPAMLRGMKGWRFVSTAPLALAERYAPELRLSLKVPPFGIRIPTPTPLPMASPSGAEILPGETDLSFVCYVSL